MSIQGAIEMAVKAVTSESVNVAGSGRTDAGAHALGQVVAFNSSSRLSTDTMLRALNAHLPRDIAVTSVWEKSASFHPRHDARSRHYRYLIWNRQVRSPFWEGRAAHVPYFLDAELMDSTAQSLIGTHNYDAFVPTRMAGTASRTMFHASCKRAGYLISVDLVATGFMRQMVRTIVGTLIAVGARQLTEPDLKEILTSRRRERAGVTAPACGLYLVDVAYDTQHPRSQQVEWDTTSTLPEPLHWENEESE